MQGKVKNRAMGKAEAESFIKDFWIQRAASHANPKKADKLSSPAEFLYDMIKTKFGVPSAMAEFA
jgi:hypothetical protein